MRAKQVLTAKAPAPDSTVRPPAHARIALPSQAASTGSQCSVCPHVTHQEVEAEEAPRVVPEDFEQRLAMIKAEGAAKAAAAAPAAEAGASTPLLPFECTETRCINARLAYSRRARLFLLAAPLTQLQRKRRQHNACDVL